MTEMEKLISEVEGDHWKVTTDKEAEWVIDTCNANLVEVERYIKSLEEKMHDLQEKMNKAQAEKKAEIAWRDNHLIGYFETVDPKLRKKTKTQEKYRLPSGEIIKKYPAPQIVRTDDDLVKWLKKANLTDLVQTKETPMWGELKKQTMISGNKVVYLSTGEIIDGVQAVDRPPTIEFKGDK